MGMEIFYTASQVNEMVNSGNIPDSGFMEVSGSNFNIGRNILGKGNTPDFIKSFEDRLKGEDGKFGGGDGMFGGNGGLAALAALYGKATYDASKERQGGLSLTPEVSMDSLGRYSLAKSLGTGGTREEFGLGPAPKSLSLNMGGEARQYFNQGGLAAIAELDMRDGGESDGPGTGTSDDIPAMLSDGEFVMTAKATKGAGAFNVNKTKSGIELISGGKASRKKGVENMRELMDIFEAI